MLSRRQLIGNTVFFGALAGIGLSLPGRVAGGATPLGDMKAAIGGLERARGGRLGVALLDLATGAGADWRGEERFAMCSTFKFLLAAFILSRVDAGAERLDRVVMFGKQDLVQWSPLTGPQAGKGMSVAALCEAIIIQSDNTGANVLMRESGGPEALTAFLRRVGDRVTRVDRIEPGMNVVPAGDERDTTTPLSMLGLMRSLLIGDVLTPASRQRLTDWMIDNRTGGARLRAGLPAGWRIGDKTGSYGALNNDIAIIWPPAGGPLLLTSYYQNEAASSEERSAMHAELAALVARRYKTA
ncbi:class A beta-lactamase [Niveispirillum sp.]|uniref:class A beta-lactamase n=1 Tax=Niveispirillum sp. TaxID=1917217 RepID=UPI001B75AE96|nr:class A beta-lactamase [Niveispirillum sp.]MBP7335117.1 class A beta-lactamase [Niveispirillum sp.]